MHEAFTSSSSLQGVITISFIYMDWMTYPMMRGNKAGGQRSLGFEPTL